MTATTKKNTPKGKSRGVSSKRSPYRKSAYEAFIEWSTWTTKERQEHKLPTARAFAKRYKVSESQLSRWKQRKDYLSAKTESLRLKLRDYTPDVLNGLKERCIKYGKSADIEFWLLLVEGWKVYEKEEDTPEYFGLDSVEVLAEYLTDTEKEDFYRKLATLISKAQRNALIDSVG